MGESEKDDEAALRGGSRGECRLPLNPHFQYLSGTEPRTYWATKEMDHGQQMA